MEPTISAVDEVKIDETSKVNIPKGLDTQTQLVRSKSVVEHELINE